MKEFGFLLLAIAFTACRGDRERKPAAATAAAVQDTVQTRSPLDDELGPFTVDGRAFTVKFDKQRLGSDEHVVRLRIFDEAGVVHVEERFDSAAAMNGLLEYTITVGATALHGERGQGLLLWYEYVPSAPLAGISVKVFSHNGERLTAIAPALTVYGTFHELGRDSATQAERLLPGDVMNVEVWQVWFGVVVPVQVDLACVPVGGSMCVRPEPRSWHESSGLGLFDVNAQPAPVAKDTTVMLYSAPEGRVVARVPVRKNSRVSLVEVAAEPAIGGEEGTLDLTVQREWLHIRIDGRSGWISGSESYGAIGLRPAG